jgi:hypothetical protein
LMALCQMNVVLQNRLGAYRTCLASIHHKHSHNLGTGEAQQ